MATSPSDRAPEGGARYDLAVVGAGPAGLAGALAAADHGLGVVLIDSSPRPGGQYYRHPGPGLGAARPQALHHGWPVFSALARRLEAHRRSGRITHLAGHQVWSVQRDAAQDTRSAGADGSGSGAAEGDAAGGRAASGRPQEAGPGPGGWALRTVGTAGPSGGPGGGAAGNDVSPGSGAGTVRARGLLLATGAYERQLPFPGWTLPGVVGAGGAQAMLKAGLVLPGRRIVVAGSGPLLLAVAASLASAGAHVPAVVEAAGYLGYGRRLGALAANPGKAAEGARFGAALLRHGVRLRSRSAVTGAHGRARVEAVTVAALDRDWRPVPGSEQTIACDVLAVGHGLVPQLELAVGLGCETRTTADGTPALVVDTAQRTTVGRVWAAGETAGVGGVGLALCEGELAGLSAAAVLGGAAARRGRDATAAPAGGQDGAGGVPGPVPAAPRASRAAALGRRRARMRGFADAMAAVHRPGPGWTAWLTDDTEVCRCEEVPASAVREAAGEYGAGDPRTVKLLTRAGMGWCQGRMCGPAVACLAAGGDGGTPVGTERRPLSCPVPMSRLAALPPVPPDAGTGAAGRGAAGSGAGEPGTAAPGPGGSGTAGSGGADAAPPAPAPSDPAPPGPAPPVPPGDGPSGPAPGGPAPGPG